MLTIHDGESPTLVFIAQNGTGGGSWKPVIDRLTCGSAVITYDRPGTGAAPPRTAPNPPLPYSRHAAELAALLDHHQQRGPFVLVGHSVGSLIARMFAHADPSSTAGMVHVDGSIPRLSLWPAGPANQPTDGPSDEATAWDVLAGETEIIQADAPEVPTAVITRTPGRWPDGYPGADPLWTAYQRQLARQTRAPLVIADNAGHQIPREAPELVAYVIDRVVLAAQLRLPWSLPLDELAAHGGRLDPAIAAPR